MRTSLLCLLLAVSAGPAAAVPNVSPETEARLDQGLTALYELEYAKSRAISRKLIEEQPDNPFGYLFEAGAIWWQASQEYGLFKDTPTLQGLFEQDVEAAIRKAELLIDSKDKELRADGYFVSGMTLGTRGQWLLMKGKWLDAFGDGKKAIKHLKRCVKLDEDYHDAYLGLGVFDYQSAQLGGIAKIGAFLGGMRGDEKRGLERIRRAIDHARIARRQAAQFLLSLYLIDKKDDVSALPLVLKLRGDFPNSVYYVFLESMLRWKLGEHDAAIALGKDVYKHAAADPKGFRRKQLTLVCGLSGADCLGKRDLNGAVAFLDAAVAADAKDKPSQYRAFLKLNRALVLDALGRRDEAVKDFQKVEFLPAFDDSKALARSCLAKPCDRETALKRLRDLSKEE